eukprot:gb/GECG01003351.1/.p1 GENE.gb/GECG01003351.1/~~gb/GECG01003351.1/.p1  ORF type:complete len:138 (+),score=17.11 gb/GECG01003351.1/:1-414(+)
MSRLQAIVPSESPRRLVRQTQLLYHRSAESKMETTMGWIADLFIQRGKQKFWSPSVYSTVIKHSSSFRSNPAATIEVEMEQLNLVTNGEGTTNALQRLKILREELIPHFSSRDSVHSLLLKEYHLAVETIQVLLRKP